MKTKQDFIAIIDQTADKYDQVAALRRAGDPRYFQLQEAMATMFAMLSQQIEIAMMEPFGRVRDATVLADASLKGIVPKATPVRVQLAAENTSTADNFVVQAGRRLTDSSGHIYEVDIPVIVPRALSSSAPGVAVVTAYQQTQRVITHTVSETRSFYSIEIEPSPDGLFLAGVQVSDEAGNPFSYRPGFTNVEKNEKVFTVEIDEYQRIFVRFGISGTVGYQPTAGEKFSLTLTESHGDVRPKTGGDFSLEYAYTPQDSLVNFKFVEIVTAGSNPIGISELRELAKYPSAYNDSAVFLGEFDFLVRRKITNLRFLSIWNEQIEEGIRGASIDNINCLFVAFAPADGESKPAVFEKIKAIILGADDSYQVKNIEPVNNTIAVTVEGVISRINDPVAVEQQIRAAILAEFGDRSTVSRRGMQPLQNRRLSEVLKASVRAFQDPNSDFSAVLTAPPGQALPEAWRYVTDSSITVALKSSDYGIDGWGG